MKTWRAGRWRKRCLTLLCLAGLSAMFALTESSCSRQEVAEPLTASAATAWLTALRAGQAQPALELATTALSSRSSLPLPEELAKVAQTEALPAELFLAPQFGPLDFQLWYDAHFLGKLARDLTANAPNDPLPKLLEGIRQQVRPEEKSFGPLPWPAMIWVRQYGLCDRMSWLFAEMAYQLGYDPVIVYLTDPQTSVSAHTICEVRNPAGEIWTVDAFSGRILAGISVKDLAGNPELAQQFWPDQPEWQRQLAGAQYWLPVYPQDCAERNQRLARALRKHLGEQLPRFGEPPEERLALARRRLNPAKVDYWFFPFRVMNKALATPPTPASPALRKP